MEKFINKLKIFGAPFGRILISLIFVMSGINKLTNYQSTEGWMESMGVPGILLPIVIILELFGGIAIVVGWNTKIFAFMFASFCILSALIFHSDFTSQIEISMFMKNLAIAGGFLFLVIYGAGNYSIDKKNNK